MSLSRVRADVMPMPDIRGPSMDLLNPEPSAEFRQRRVPGQVDLQRRDRGVPFGDGVKVRAGPGILAGAGIAHPIYLPAPRVARPHDGLAAMAVAKASH